MSRDGIRKLGVREWPVVVVLMVPAAALWGFIELADEVIEGGTGDIDKAILLALRTSGIQPIRSDPNGFRR